MATRFLPRPKASAKKPARRARYMGTAVEAEDNEVEGLTKKSGGYKIPEARKTYRNEKGVLLDENGILVSFKEAKRQDDARFEEVLGAPADTPLELMLGVMKDPRMPIGVRMDMATKAAPYVHRRMPLAIESPNPDGPAMNFDMVAMSKLSKPEQRVLLDMLKKLGVKL